MKKLFIVAILGILTCSVNAQNYRDSRYYNSQTDRLDYGGGRNGFNLWGDDVQQYVGFRVGPSFANVYSDVPALKDLDSRTGLNLGVVFGRCITSNQPVFVETGLSYTEKGCKAVVDGDKVTTSLCYLEVPLAFKYRYAIDDHIKLEPFFGGFFALGLGGSIKDYATRTSCSSFNNGFRRCDAGLKIGCGLSYDMFYVEMDYDLGLANVYDDSFDSTHTGAFQINFGVNF